MSATGGERPGDAGGPDDAAWARAGVPRDEVPQWTRWRIGPAQARAWRDAGVTEALAAAQWETAAVSAATVGDWTAAGIDAAEAVRWHEFGFDLERAKDARAKGQSPTDALDAERVALNPANSFGFSPSTAGPVHKFLQARIDHWLIHDYMRHQWHDDAAVAWARQGIGPIEAHLWHDLGLTPVEAGRLVADGLTVGEVVRAWWATGIPFAEVADWIGAGLTPDEAVRQRNEGVTGEQAAALRALRQDDGSPRPGPPNLLARIGPPGTERPGPPPQDEESARAAVVDTFTTMLTTYDDGGGLRLVDGGSNLGPSLQEARERVGGGTRSVTTITVRGVRFINDHQARVAYDVDVRGGFTSQLHGRIGGAVLVDGTWKATRDTITDLIALAGVTCPPPPPAT
jgi:hypothetical protein